MALTGSFSADMLMPGLSRDTSPFIKAEEIQRVKGEHAGIAADSNPETHRVVRKMVAPAFSRRALKEQEPAVHQHIDRLIDKLIFQSRDGADMTEVRRRHDYSTCIPDFLIL